MAASQQIHYCSYFEQKILWPIAECSAYRARGELSLWQMDSMAMLIESKDGKIGFRRLTKEEIGETKDWK